MNNIISLHTFVMKPVFPSFAVNKLHCLFPLISLFLQSCTTGTPTKDMNVLIQEAYKNIPVAKTANLFNERKVHYYDSLSKVQNDKSLFYIGKMGYELLNAGKTKEAIQVFEGLLDSLQQKENVYGAYIPGVKQLLALGYMRYGEQQNCILKHNSSSCIVPIADEGFHILQDGSSRAISIYRELLEDDPTDLSSRWLMNIAYMTLGHYPDSVPKKWLIPPASFASQYTMETFVDVAPGLGVDVVGLAGGTCVDDFNNDGLNDILCSSWGYNGRVHYFRNKGDGSFEDATNASNLTNVIGGLNMVHADYDNDGYLDVLILRGAWFAPEGRIPNSLLRNNGDGTFSDVTQKSGLFRYNSSQTAAWGDINNDGWLDLFIGTESSLKNPQNCELYLNNGNGTFTDITKKAGLNGKTIGWVKGCAFGDINNDGWQDLFVSLYNGQNKMFLNAGGAKIQKNRFLDISRSAGIGEPLHSFPTWFWDFDNDGWLDLFVAAYPVGSGLPSSKIVAANYLGIKTDDRSKIYRNNRDNTFTDVSAQMGLTDAIFTMGCNYGDLDNDGYEDFYLGTGDPDLMSIYPNRMFRNDAGKRFLDVTTSGGFGHIQKGHGIGFGDLDEDGDQDIYMVMGGGQEGDVFQNVLFENPIRNRNNWITIQFRGTLSNTYAIGARIKLMTENAKGERKEYFRTISSGGSFGGSSLQLEMGLADAIRIVRMEIDWPNLDRSKSIFFDLPINQKIRIVEGSGSWTVVETRPFTLNGTVNQGGRHHH